MQKISKDMIIADLVQIDQNIIPILMREGMHCIGCPSAQAETLEEAALVHGLDPDVLVARLNNFLGSRIRPSIKGCSLLHLKSMRTSL